MNRELIQARRFIKATHLMDISIQGIIKVLRAIKMAIGHSRHRQ
jgi:hypothetical protein